MKAFAALLLLVYLPGSSEVDTRGVLPKWCFETGIEQPFMGRFWYTLPNSTNDCSKVLLFRESDFEYESASCKPLRVRSGTPTAPTGRSGPRVRVQRRDHYPTPCVVDA
jgi:hypothetical protein